MFCIYISYAANTFQYFFHIFIYMQGGVGSDRGIGAKPVSQRQLVRKLRQNFIFGGNGENRMTNTTINHRGEGYRYTRNMTINFCDYITSINTNNTTAFNKYQYLELGVSYLDLRHPPLPPPVPPHYLLYLSRMHSVRPPLGRQHVTVICRGLVWMKGYLLATQM